MAILARTFQAATVKSSSFAEQYRPKSCVSLCIKMTNRHQNAQLLWMSHYCQITTINHISTATKPTLAQSVYAT